MIPAFQVTAAMSVPAAEAAPGGSRSAAGSTRVMSGPAAGRGGLVQRPVGASGAAFTAVLADHYNPAARVPPREVEAAPSGDAVPASEREAARAAADEALRAFAAPLALDITAGGWQGIAALSAGQGNAWHALDVPASVAPAPDTREPGPPAAPVGIEGSRAAPLVADAGEGRARRAASSPRPVEVTGVHGGGATHLRSPLAARLAAPAAGPTTALGPASAPTAATNARTALTGVTQAPAAHATTVTADASSVRVTDPTVTQRAGTLTATRAGGAVLADMTSSRSDAAMPGQASAAPPAGAPAAAGASDEEALAFAAATAGASAGPGSSRPDGASDPAPVLAAEQALPEPHAYELDETPRSQPAAARERAPDGPAAARPVLVAPSIAVSAAAEVAGAPVALGPLEPERRTVVWGVRPARPSAARRSGDEAEAGVLSLRPSQRAADATAGGPAARVVMAALDATPRPDEADALGARASEAGDERAVTVAAPGQPAAAAKAEASPADAAASARSVAEQVAEQVAERLGLIRRPGRHEISLELRPADLGTVHVAARLEGRQLTLEIRAELAQARDLLQQALPQLRESLAQQGIVAERVTVHLGLDTSARDFSGQHFGAPRHFMLEDMLPAAAARTEAPVRRRQLGSGTFDFWV